MPGPAAHAESAIDEIVHPLESDAAGRREHQDQLLHTVGAALAALEEGLPRPDSAAAGAPHTQSRDYRGKLAVLRALLEMRSPVLEPQLDARAPRGHSCRSIEEALELERGQALEMLEDLADLGLLERELFNRVHLCPRCRHCQVNFRETCPLCTAIDLEIESLVHHFPCAYIGLEPEFVQGIDLVCPKCRRRLHQLGQDFERPHETYVCRDCGNTAEEPFLHAQCLHCSYLFPGAEVELARIYRYRPTVLTVRAVELNRLTGLDISEIMIDAKVGLATRDFLVLEIQRELYRMRRYKDPFSVATLFFEAQGAPYPIAREWRTEAIRELGRLFTSSLRNLDLVALFDHSRIAVLLPQTDAPGMGAVRERFRQRLGELSPRTRSGNELEPRWADATYGDPDATLEEIVAFLDGDEGAEP